MRSYELANRDETTHVSVCKQVIGGVMCMSQQGRLTHLFLSLSSVSSFLSNGGLASLGRDFEEEIGA